MSKGNAEKCEVKSKTGVIPEGKNGCLVKAL